MNNKRVRGRVRYDHPNGTRYKIEMTTEGIFVRQHNRRAVFEVPLWKVVNLGTRQPDLFPTEGSPNAQART